jgi:hypothetical protein
VRWGLRRLLQRRTGHLRDASAHAPGQKLLTRGAKQIQPSKYGASNIPPPPTSIFAPAIVKEIADSEDGSRIPKSLGWSQEYSRRNGISSTTSRSSMGAYAKLSTGNTMVDSADRRLGGDQSKPQRFARNGLRAKFGITYTWR